MPAPPAGESEQPLTPAARGVARWSLRRRALAQWAVGALVFGLLYGGALLLLRRLDLEGAATALADRAGVWGVLLFVALMAAAVMSPLPDSPIALAGLVIYGPLPGMGLIVVGSWLGAVADFALVRLLGRERFRRRFPRLAAPMDDLAERLGFELLVLLRVLPTVSFDVVSYTAAVTHIPFVRFASATLLGQLPGPTVAALVGSGVEGSNPARTYGLGALMVALIVVFLVVRRAARQRLALASARAGRYPAPDIAKQGAPDD